MKDEFSSLHPALLFAFFLSVMAISMAASNPFFSAISFLTAFIYSLFLNGKKTLKFNLLYMLPLFLLVALINPFFSHRGATILFYFNRNPVTLESFVYGGAAALKFISVIMWFSCYNAVMTSDKFIYLFGRLIPSLSLIFSMALRLVPRYTAQIKVISNAQKCIGRDASNGTLMQKFKNGVRIISVMTTWALENSIETANSMKSRGYGLKGRTTFSLFRFDTRDFITFGIMLALAALFALSALNMTAMEYYPIIKIPAADISSLSAYCLFALFCFLPMAFNAGRT